ncbi:MULTISPECIES: hypothetical protein [Corynebacterium]|uniref:hypothetical protein n=1 Tax=Corynebacterium TaxID=1716 RepID=UPI002934294E|nr:hypothetical protein [Corynebacterium sp. CTNIH16]MDV2425654.1 hypothetical protein [Corynebacterium sp. CTNIH16]
MITKSQTASAIKKFEARLEKQKREEAELAAEFEEIERRLGKVLAACVYEPSSKWAAFLDRSVRELLVECGAQVAPSREASEEDEGAHRGEDEGADKGSEVDSEGSTEPEESEDEEADEGSDDSTESEESEGSEDSHGGEYEEADEASEADSEGSPEPEESPAGPEQTDYYGQ